MLRVAAFGFLDRRRSQPGPTLLLHCRRDGPLARDTEEPGMATVDLTKENFEQTVAAHDMVVVDFWAPWCGPCRFFAPVFEAASDKHDGIVFGKVNTDEQSELAGMFGIRSIPTLMVMRQKVVIYHEAGALPAGALDDILAQAKELDMAKVHEELEKRDREA
jgi:thioredoxin 1